MEWMDQNVLNDKNGISGYCGSRGFEVSENFHCWRISDVHAYIPS